MSVDVVGVDVVGIDVCCGIWPGGEGEWWSTSHGRSVRFSCHLTNKTDVALCIVPIPRHLSPS